MLDIPEDTFNEFNNEFTNLIGINNIIEVENILEWLDSKKCSSVDFQSFHELFNAFFIGDKTPYVDDIKLCFKYFDKNEDDVLDFEEFKEMCIQIFEPFLNPQAALLIIDVQNDFISGSLALKKCHAKEDGEDVVPIINSILVRYLNKELQFESVVYTHDWHPKDHISFFDNIQYRRISPLSLISMSDVKPLDKVIVETESGEEIEQILWPRHCVENTEGAALHKDLMVVDGAYHLKKGTSSNVDSYSAFGLNHPNAVTSLDNHLKNCNINLLFICGLATDVCVAQTSFDALKLGYRLVLVKEACRGVNKTNIDNFLEKLDENNGIIIKSEMISHIIKGKVRPIQLAVFLIRNLIENR